MAVPAIMKNASLLAKNRRKNISQNLPIKSAGYTLVLAQSSGTTVKMTISEAGAQTTQTPDAFLTSYQRQMCADPTVKLPNIMHSGREAEHRISRCIDAERVHAR